VKFPLFPSKGLPKSIAKVIPNTSASQEVIQLKQEQTVDNAIIAISPKNRSFLKRSRTRLFND